MGVLAASTPVEGLGAAAIDDLLERGDLGSWRMIASAVRADPTGALADTILRLCAAHPMYGTTSLWRTWIERLRRGNKPRAVGLAELRTRAGATQQDVAGRMGSWKFPSDCRAVAAARSCGRLQKTRHEVAAG